MNLFISWSPYCHCLQFGAFLTNKHTRYILRIHNRHTNSKRQQPCRHIFQLGEFQGRHKRMIHRRFQEMACSLLEIVWRSQSLKRKKINSQHQRSNSFRTSLFLNELETSKQIDRFKDNVKCHQELKSSFNFFHSVLLLSLQMISP